MLTKAAAIEFFSGRPALAVAVGVTPQAISDWPDVLPRRIADRVIAAAIRAGRDVPAEWIEPNDELQAA